jgi:hypothetical protein
MCFTCNFSSSCFSYLFDLLHVKYGIQVQSWRTCTSVWTFSLFSRVGDLSKLYAFISNSYPALCVELEPELFSCISLIHVNVRRTTIRIFHTGKVVLLGVLNCEQLSCAIDFLSVLFYDYSLSRNFDNFYAV